MKRPCTECGACCVAPDIAALDKPLGLRCPHLLENNRCAVYEQRPQICRDYEPDALCDAIASETLEQRVQKYLALFGLEAEAAQIRASGITSRAKLLAQRAPPAPVPLSDD